MVLKVIMGIMLLLCLWFAIEFIKDYVKNYEREKNPARFVKLILTGFVTNFFDTLGIGSFAPTTALFKLGNLVHDKNIPGTLNVGDTIPVIMEALIFMTVIKVDIVTLGLLLAAAAIGAYIGAGIVSKLPEKKIQIGMGTALMLAVFFMLAGKFGWLPSGGDAIGLSGGKLIFATVIHFILGALMTLGIGLYAPSMALIYALGLNPRIAFPIMMGACAYLMPVAGVKFCQEGAHDRKGSLGLTLGGIPGVLIAAYIVKSLPLDILQWLVIIVVLYTSVTMLRAAARHAEKPVSKKTVEDTN